MKLKEFLEQIMMMEISFKNDSGHRLTSTFGENSYHYKQYIFEIYHHETLKKMEFEDIKDVPEELLNMNFIKLQIFCESSYFGVVNKYKILVSN
jgi:hypothetical protein